MENNGAFDAFEQITILLESIEQHPEEAVRNHVRALVFTLLEINQGAWRRVVDIIGMTPDGQDLLDTLSADEYVRAVFLIHGLEHDPLAVRVERALAEARQALKSYDADVELVSVEESVAKLRLLAGAAAANVSTALLTAEIEQALRKYTPDLLNVQYDEIIAPPKPLKLVQIAPRREKPIAGDSKYIPLVSVDQVPDNDLRVIQLGDVNVLLCRHGGTIFAFENACPHQSRPLGDGIYEGGVLTCPWHGYQFDVKHNGKCLTDPALKLKALPMQVRNDVVSVVLPAEV